MASITRKSLLSLSIYHVKSLAYIAPLIPISLFFLFKMAADLSVCWRGKMRRCIGKVCLRPRRVVCIIIFTLYFPTCICIFTRQPGVWVMSTTALHNNDRPVTVHSVSPKPSTGSEENNEKD